MTVYKKAFTEKGVFLSLIFMLLLPNFIYVWFETSSLASGFLLASGFILLFNVKQINTLHIKALCAVLVVSCLLMLHSFYMFYFRGDVRSLSALALVGAFSTAPLFSSKLAKVGWGEFEKSLKLFIHTLVMVGWIGLAYKFVFLGWEQKIKYPFPFSEPSLFALCYGMFSVAYSFVASRRFVFYIVLNMLLFSFLFPSLTFLLFVVIVIGVMVARLRMRYFFMGIFIVPVILLSIGFFLIQDIQYFSDRLKFSGAENITTLVWLQGWDLSYLNLNATGWWGLGFQMLGGEGTELSEISYKLESITGKFMNLTSGGFLAAKIISEFGIVGMIVTLAYMLFLIFFYVRVGASPGCRFESGEAKKKLVFQGLVLGYVVEFFFRGYGYFSPCLYILVAALMAVWHMGADRRGGGTDSALLKLNSL